ncbi:MAG: transposase [Lachnospiraceae bacterium]|nr:transposase [Lachnospiraceae bacterium]
MSPEELSKLTPEQLKELLPEGWKYNQSPDGRFVHIKDASGNYRIRIDPPDSYTSYDHIHVFDQDGNSLDINGNIVPYDSPDAHIPRP